MAERPTEETVTVTVDVEFRKFLLGLLAIRLLHRLQPLVPERWETAYINLTWGRIPVGWMRPKGTDRDWEPVTLRELANNAGRWEVQE